MSEDVTEEMILRGAFGMCIHGAYPHPNRRGPSYYPPCARCMANSRKCLDAALVSPHREQVQKLREALRLTREYVGEHMLPAADEWSWYEAAKATGGLDGFGGCGRVLDPQVWGRMPLGNLCHCTLPAAHNGECGLKDE